MAKKRNEPNSNGGGLGANSVEYVPVADLIPYARNARTHSDEQIAQIAGSIQEFGFNNPVLIDGQNSIIAGHGRVLAAGRLKLEQVPCIRLTHLTDAQRRAYILADNRIALNSEWDEAMLSNELSDLHADELDLGLLGFEVEELEILLTIDQDPKEILQRESDSRDGLDRNYGDSAIRQIVLVFDQAQYETVLDAFGGYAEQHGLSNNTEVVLHLLEANGHAVSQRDDSSS